MVLSQEVHPLLKKFRKLTPWHLGRRHNSDLAQVSQHVWSGARTGSNMALVLPMVPHGCRGNIVLYMVVAEPPKVT
jgi:hypothetical protein